MDWIISCFSLKVSFLARWAFADVRLDELVESIGSNWVTLFLSDIELARADSLAKLLFLSENLLPWVLLLAYPLIFLDTSIDLLRLDMFDVIEACFIIELRFGEVWFSDILLFTSRSAF